MCASWLALTSIAAAAPDPAPFPAADWPRASPASLGLDADALHTARDYALSGEGSGCVVVRGSMVLEWGDQARRYDLKSTTKSFGAAALGLALLDGKIALDDAAARYQPGLGVPPESNRDTGWIPSITLRHLATHTAGFEKPGGFEPLRWQPGTRWAYSDGGPNWLAECLTLIYRRDLNDLLFERLFSPIGIRPADLTWRNNAYRPRLLDGVPRREFGSGISANVQAMARFGYLFLREGHWEQRQLLAPSFIQVVRKTDPALPNLPVEKPGDYGKASAHYGLLWWNNNDGTLSGVPRDAYWSWGLYDSLIVVIPSLDVVVARAGKSFQRQPGWGHYDVLKPFLQPIAATVRSAGVPSDAAAHPSSPVIRAFDWAPASSIGRAARGSDNWPLTWADDDALYTAYGDGRGFEPGTPRKLSLGLARVTGGPDDFIGTNLSAPSLEQLGDGASGRKASGLLMVEGVLYLWARNATNAQLAWSADHGATWTWADWNFTESFGCPTFLNFGRNYQGARDEFVYVYSQDANDAYTPADQFVLARVPRDRITRRDAYQFLVRIDAQGNPVWSRDVRQRGPVFRSPGRCYRSGITYNAGLKRYLWCQILPGEDTRFQGGFAIYDAPEPWGPWTLAFLDPDWDVAPGETCSFPTKWMSPDGRTMHLVFSGEDHFSVRQVTVHLDRD